MQDVQFELAAISGLARVSVAERPIKPGDAPNRSRVIAVSNDVLATEIVCWLRYQQHAGADEGCPTPAGPMPIRWSPAVCHLGDGPAD